MQRGRRAQQVRAGPASAARGSIQRTRRCYNPSGLSSAAIHPSGPSNICNPSQRPVQRCKHCGATSGSLAGLSALRPRVGDGGPSSTATAAGQQAAAWRGLRPSAHARGKAARPVLPDRWCGWSGPPPCRCRRGKGVGGQSPHQPPLSLPPKRSAPQLRDIYIYIYIYICMYVCINK